MSCFFEFNLKEIQYQELNGGYWSHSQRKMGILCEQVRRNMSEMKEMCGRQQLLVVTMEECGELIQACSKALRKQELFEYQNLKDEIGDVMCMLELMQDWDVVSYAEIEERVSTKRAKLAQWSELIW